MEGVVPESVLDSVRRTSKNIDDLKTLLPEFLTQCTPDSLSELEPLERAKSLLLLAKATTTLFSLRLRCQGVHPDDHPVKTELERLSLFHDKLESYINLSKAPLRPSAIINSQAAARFIEHSLPDLTPEQKQGMRDISRGEGGNFKYVQRAVNKKRKCPSGEKKSVQTAAQEFLDKAARELLGDNNGGLKGPLQDLDLSYPKHCALVKSRIVLQLHKHTQGEDKMGEEWRKMADTHKMSPEDMKKAGVESSKRPPGQNPGGVLHQRKSLPYSPYAMAVGGLLIIGGIAYATLYTKKKPEASAGDVARVTAGVGSVEDTHPRNTTTTTNNVSGARK